MPDHKQLVKTLRNEAEIMTWGLLTEAANLIEEQAAVLEGLANLAEDLDVEAEVIEQKRQDAAALAPGTTGGFIERARAESRVFAASRLRAALQHAQEQVER